MGNFKKLKCIPGCPEPSGFVDCNGETIYEGEALVTCDSAAALKTVVSVTNTLDGKLIATILVDGTPYNINQVLASITGALTSGVAIGTFSDGNGGTVTMYAPAPTTVVVTGQAPGKPISTINVNGTPVNVNESITTLDSVSYNPATGELSVTYTNETGVAVTKKTTIQGQATAFFNGTNPTTATIFSLETPPTVNDNTLKNNPDYVYAGTDGSYWFWNGSAYVTAPVPAQTTEWYVAGTTVDAKSDKVNKIARAGWTTIGKNVIPLSPLDVYSTGVNAYSVLGRYLNPDNKVANNNTQLIFGAAQEVGNAADWRFFYAGNNSVNNRIDFGFSGYATPMLTYTVGYRVGVRTTTPTSTLQVNGSFSTPITLSSGAITLTEFHHTLLLSSGGTNQTLPSATGIDGRIYVIKNTGATASSITGLIQSGVSNTIPLPSGASRTLQAYGGQWWIIDGYL